MVTSRKTPAPEPTPQTHLIIHRAREHNLKNISLAIPKRTLTVITGVSGSGKSSLAFDTIYAEGQRRYVESLSAYARQFLELNRKPDVDKIDGLAPAIAIEQKTTSKNPRSTVGTITEIYDYLRLLYANAGIPHCPNHPEIEIRGIAIQQMVDQIMAESASNPRIMVMAPVVRGRKGEYKKELQLWQAQGYTRAVIDGELIELAEFTSRNAKDHQPEAGPSKPAGRSRASLEKNEKHDISLVIDRLVAKPESAQRLADSLATALKLGEGLAEVASVSAEKENQPQAGPSKLVERSRIERKMFSQSHACPVCGTSVELEPRLFSFNSPFGACQECDGLGEVIFFSADTVVPDPSLTLNQGAIHPWLEGHGPRKKLSRGGGYYLGALSRHYKFSLDTPWQKLPENVQQLLLHGSPAGDKIEFAFEGGLQGSGRRFTTRKPFDGILKILQRRWDESDNPFQREDLNRYRAAAPCPVCRSARLNPTALAVTLPVPAPAHAHSLTNKAAPATGTNIHTYCQLPINHALDFTATLQDKLSGNAAQIAAPILREIHARLGFLAHVGLGYLSLERTAGTLSGGESQRIRLASQIGSGLTGVLYVLDEPSIGLHQRDNARLLETLHRLRDLDNTVIVVEHDEDAIRQADHLIDIGPLAGEHGGHIIAAGTAADIIAEPKSITGAYLRGERRIEVPKKRRLVSNTNPALQLRGARGNNLKNLDVDVPLGVLTCITGVSGSGKSTLVMDTLYTAVANRLTGARDQAAPFTSLTGAEHLDKLVNIDQSPIGRTPRSNPATYTGLYGPIRDWFAGLPESKARGYGPGRFSFNVKGGRCEKCEGDGVIKVEMHFLPDVYVTCEVCDGKRFNRETLEVLYKGKTIADILHMPVNDALDFFSNIPPIQRKLSTLHQVGLGYIRLGQAATTLSGGEAQRVKLAKELSTRSTGKTLYILDEPTTGLHFYDIDQLLHVLHKLVDGGNSMIIIEHNLDVIKTADWVIDIGPEGGAAGGQLLAAGTPEDLVKVKGSHTGHYLAPLLQQTAKLTPAPKTKPVEKDKKEKSKSARQQAA